MSEMSGAARERLVADVKTVMADAEELLKITAGEAGAQLNEVRSRLGEKLADARVRLAELEDEVIAKGRAAAKATDVYVHDNPWKAVGIAAGAGLLIGLLIGRR